MTDAELIAILLRAGVKVLDHVIVAGDEHYSFAYTGSNTCIYSNPKEELGATQHNVQISNRRFRDDEFLIPRDLTEGRSAIRVRVNFTPVSVPLFPGHPVGELAWSEIKYTAYCFVLPRSQAASRSR